MLKRINFDVELLSTAPKMQFTEQTIYTNDLDSAEIVFNILDSGNVNLSTATASVLLFMKDGSFFQNNTTTGVTVGTNTVSYKIKENEGNHSGLARVQLVVVAGNVEYATQHYRFRIESGLETLVAQEVMIADWTTLTREARDYIDEMEANEAIRLSQEIARKNSEDVRILSEIARVNNEQVRTSEENQRVNAESLRMEQFGSMQLTQDLDSGKSYKTTLEIYNGMPRLKLEEVM